jgi:Bax protein
MLHLNKIIYWLLGLVLLECGFLGIYMVSNSFFQKEEINYEVIKKELVFSSSKKNLIQKIENNITIQSLDDVLVHVSPNSELDIVSIKNQSVKPILYTKSINFSNLSLEKKKKNFIDMMIRSILIAKHRIVEERKKVKKLLTIKELSAKDSLWLTKKRHIFKASNIDELYNKMELHPTSIVIAQAIIESGWGTSRFFEKANNVFGIWSFNEHEKRIAASKKRGDKTIYLKKYSSVEQSISDYFLMLSTKDAYQDFREVRLESQNPFTLIEQLGKYSELGEEYIDNLKNTIEKNELLAYDSYSLDI